MPRAKALPRPTDDETPECEIWSGLYPIFENDAALKVAFGPRPGMMEPNGIKMSVEIIATEEKYRGWCTLLLAQVRYPDGRIVKREIEDHGRAACVLPYDAARKTALLVRQLRVPPLYAGGEATLLEAPAGLIDPGEDGSTAARREAMEEVGVRLASLDLVSSAWSMPGISAERMDLFLGSYAAAYRTGSGGGIDDEGIEVVEMPLSALAAMADAGTLNDMKTLVLLQTLRLRRPELFG
jgi:nudix-type nucleoside diphosphatase (YffH/AdpP family)